MSNAQTVSAQNIKNLFDLADENEMYGNIATFEHIETYKPKGQTIKDYAPALVIEIGNRRRLADIYRIHRVVKYLRAERVDVDGDIVTADAYIAGSEYMAPLNNLDDLIRYAKKNDLHILDAMEQTQDLDWDDIKTGKQTDKKNKLAELREYLESVKGNGATKEAKAVAIKALEILS